MYANVLVAVDFEHEKIGQHLVAVGRFLAGKGKVTVLHVVQSLPTYVGRPATSSRSTARRLTPG
jgi:nucleotide-binding universal stress UspA family protein